MTGRGPGHVVVVTGLVGWLVGGAPGSATEPVGPAPELASLAMQLGGEVDDVPPLVETIPRTWGIEIDVATEAKVPFLGKIHVLTRSLAVAQLVHGPESTYARQQVCGVVVEDDAKLSDTFIPSAFVDALPVQEIPFAPVGQRDGWTIRLDPGTTHVGYDVVTSEGEAPVSLDDPSVIDFEGDGHPGATVELKVPLVGRIELYVVQRSHTLFEGVGSNRQIEGPVVVQELTQNTLESSHRMFARDAPVTVDAEHSRFRWVPLPEGTTCPQWLARWTPMASEWVSTRRQITGWSDVE